LTDGDTLFTNYGEIEKLSEVLGIPVAKNCGVKAAFVNVPEEKRGTFFEMKIYIPKPWEL
jgi:hypothetical protein